jgi:hypothetical protein
MSNETNYNLQFLTRDSCKHDGPLISDYIYFICSLFNDAFSVT